MKSVLRRRVKKVKNIEEKMLRVKWQKEVKKIL